MDKADLQVDVVIVGSGGGGMTAALAAKKKGLDVLIVEKTALFGGSTALSGGGVWVPNNLYMEKEGIYDSPELAETYLKAIIGKRVPLERIRAYVKFAPEMIRFLVEEEGIELMRTPNSADYFDEPGAITNGRQLEAVPFNGKLLKEHRKELRTGVEMPLGLGMSIGEFLLLGKFKTTAAGRSQLFKFAFQAAGVILSGKERLGLGSALTSRLRYALMRENVPLWLNTPLKKLIAENGRVVGVEIEKDGKPFTIQANKGVLLAAGGFAKNQSMREEYLPQPTSADWSAANPGDTGEVIRLGMELGADVDLMDDAWWGSVFVVPGQDPFFTVGERQLPGTLIVDQSGKRFVNEAIPYTAFGHAVYEANAKNNRSIPFYMILDQTCRERYLFGTLFPGQAFPKEYFESGAVKQANSLSELAEQLQMDPATLEATVSRFNGFARGKKDQDFRKGETPFEHVYADPANWPNPTLAPVEKAPYFAVKMFPGDLGTKGGLLTDENARVLDKHGKVIPGLYATGNNSASVMGNTYAGGGATIGPSMTFGYVAALDMAKR
jgi:Succinate dehydrogenase/fumarate reductase, flavoprotein subunit